MKLTCNLLPEEAAAVRDWLVGQLQGPGAGAPGSHLHRALGHLQGMLAHELAKQGSGRGGPVARENRPPWRVQRGAP